MKAALPPNEAERLQGLYDLGILETPEEPWFDVFTAAAAQLFEAPIALISLITPDQQWFKSRIGLDVDRTPREYAFCAHAILGPRQSLVVNDTLLDARFSNNPLVLGEPRIRFYAGAVVHSPAGLPIGTLCVIDRRPRVLLDVQVRDLEALANGVDAVLKLHGAGRYKGR